MDGKVAIVGAGMAGLAAARRLTEAGKNVVLFDKSPRHGGRCATRHFAGVAADHGAQFLTVRTPEFQRLTDAWLARGLLRVWSRGFPEPDSPEREDGHPRYYAAKGMRSLMEAMAEDLPVRLGQRIEYIEEDALGWRLAIEERENVEAATLLVTPPLPQALELLPRRVVSDLEGRYPTACGVRYESSFALLAKLKGPSQLPAPGAMRFKNHDSIAWIADNRRKGVSPHETVVTIHSTAAFAAAHYHDSPQEVAYRLMECALPWMPASVSVWHLHRWRYSRPINPMGLTHLELDSPHRLRIAGDAMLENPRIEASYLSGLAAAESLL